MASLFCLKIWYNRHIMGMEYEPGDRETLEQGCEFYDGPGGQSNETPDGLDAFYDPQILPTEMPGHDDADHAEALDTPAFTPPTHVERMIGSVRSETTLGQRHPEWPEVVAHIHYANHVNADDSSEIPERMKEADVYCFEDVEGRGQVGFFQSLADGTTLADGEDIEVYIDSLSVTEGGRRLPLRGSHLENQIRAVRESGVVVGHFDLDASTDAQDARHIREYMKIAGSKRSLLALTYGRFLQKMKDGHARIGQLQADREATISGPAPQPDGDATAGRFEEEMSRIFSENPELLDKDTVRILVTLGGGHPAVYHRLNAAGVTTERSFHPKPYAFGPEIQLERMLAIGKEPSEAFLSLVFVDGIVRRLLASSCKDPRITGDDHAVMALSREISGKFTLRDGARLYRAVQLDLNIRVVLNTMMSRRELGRLPMGMRAILAANQRQADAYAAKVAAAYADMHRRQGTATP